MVRHTAYGYADLEVTKELVGRAWQEGDEFAFRLEAVTEGAPMSTSTAATATYGSPTAAFEGIEFTQAGTYEYTITEVAGDLEGVTYNATPHAVTVVVAKTEGTVTMSDGTGSRRPLRSKLQESSG